ncbi:MAG: ATP-binding protein [Prevotella sp.]|nr:ATP-binding protein [Prevotella sp.]
MDIPKRIITLLVTIVISLTWTAGKTNAAETNDAKADSIMNELRRYFNSDKKDSLYRAAAKYRAYQLNQGDIYKYYQGWQYEIFYDINFNNFYHAMRKAIRMSEDMKARNAEDQLYNATYLFGVIYSLQGNVEQAKDCFHRALDEGKHQPPTRLVQIYKELANVEMDNDPDKAMKDINHAIRITRQAKQKYAYSDAVAFKIIIAFIKKDWELVKAIYTDYLQMQKDYGDEFSMTYHHYAMMCGLAAEGNYVKAIEHADQLTNIDRYRFKTIIYELSGDMGKAFETQKTYIHVKDSINSSIMLQELHNAATDVEMNAMRHKATEDRVKKKVMAMVIFGAAVIIAILIFVIFNWRNNMKNLRKKNSELEILRFKSEEAERLKSNILQNMSHEIRTPLNIISGFTQLICQPGYTPSDEEKTEILDRITASSDNLVKIINNLLYVATTESESYASQRDDIVCNDLLRRLTETYRLTLPETVSFTLDTSIPDDFHFLGSTKGIETIIDNLLTNARKFTTEGSITLQSSFDRKKEYIIISVTDTGTGIPEAYQERVFGMFYKIDNSKEGIGAGLPLSRHIARQIGGNLSLDADYHGGARFILTIPARRP